MLSLNLQKVSLHLIGHDISIMEASHFGAGCLSRRGAKTLPPDFFSLHRGFGFVKARGSTFGSPLCRLGYIPRDLPVG